MTNNCLKNQLGAVVNNDSLEELGVLKFQVEAAAEWTTIILSAKTNINTEVSIDSPGLVRNYNVGEGSSSIIINSESSIIEYKSNSMCYIRVKSKYNIVRYQDRSINAWDLKELKYNNLTYLRCEKNPLVSGDLSNLYANVGMDTLRLRYGTFTGDLKNLVSAWISNGRTSTSVNDFFINADENDAYKVCLNGHIIQMGTVGVLAWESASKIYVTVSQSHKVWCYGYNDTEIATNIASGGIWEGLTTVVNCN